MYEVNVTLHGERIEAEALIAALRSFLALLKELDKQASSTQTVTWRLSTLRYSSPATIGFVGEPKKKKVPSNIAVVGETLYRGVTFLSEKKRPKRFTDEALTFTKQLADLHGRQGIASVAIAIKNGGEPQVAPITVAISDYVNELIGPTLESLGSIEGRLELIAARRGVLICNIHERSSGKAVRCDVPAQMKQDVLRFFDSDVVASGLVRRDASGQARQIVLDTIVPTGPRENLPTSIRGIDPDMTEGLSPAEWLKRRW